ncbi:MAG: hypothetical protein HY053_02015 [Proteobacteria bacterium]|nr:hypothetical protein [Pseudomonadota bacterium]
MRSSTVTCPRDASRSGLHLVEKLEIDPASSVANEGKTRVFPGVLRVIFVPEATVTARVYARQQIQAHLPVTIHPREEDIMSAFTPNDGVVTHELLGKFLERLYAASALTEGDVKIASQTFGIQSPKLSPRVNVDVASLYDPRRLVDAAAAARMVAGLFRPQRIGF